MSFVLEALRRARSERATSEPAPRLDLGVSAAAGDTPALADATAGRADTSPAPGTARGLPAPAPPWLLPALVGLVALALLVALAQALRPSAAPQDAVAPAAATDRSAAVVAPPSVVPRQPERAASSLEQVSPTPVPQVTRLTWVPPLSGSATGEVPRSDAVPRAVSPPASIPALATAAAPPPSPVVAPRTEEVPAATPLASLSAETRNQFPPLAIGGSIWSDDPGSRFVLISGQVVREGDTAAAGVVIERILPRSLVLRWRGQRVEVPLP